MFGQMCLPCFFESTYWLNLLKYFSMLSLEGMNNFLIQLIIPCCSGGRDLSGNKRTNKSQSSDQKFDKMNEALRLSCKLGYPVRVVR